MSNPPRSRGRRAFNAPYEGDCLNRVAFPLGGLGAGMICLEGTGNGAAGSSFGLPRFRKARFHARFPFATVTLTDPDVPLSVEVTGWSPFEPGDADNSSLPVAALEYRFTNPSKARLKAVFSFNARNFVAVGGNPREVRTLPGGFILWGGPANDKPWEETAFAAAVSEPGAKVNAAWFRGGWWDPLTMACEDVADAACFARGPVTRMTRTTRASSSISYTIR